MSLGARVKRILSKTARLLLPAAASAAVGIFFPPAAGVIAKVVNDKLASFGVEVSEDTIAEETQYLAKTAVKQAVGVDRVIERALKNTLEKQGLTPEKVEMLTNTALHPILEDFQEAAAYIRAMPDQAADELRRVWKEELAPSLDETLEKELETLASRLEHRDQQLFERLDQLSVTMSSLIRGVEDRMVELSAQLAEAFHQTPTVDELSFLSRSQISTVTFSSLFDIEYDPERYVTRFNPEGSLENFFRDVTSRFGSEHYLFALLADPGFGKTWLLAHVVTVLAKKHEQLVPFFFSARKGFDRQVQVFVGSKSLIDPTRIFLQFRDVLRPTGKLPLIVVDGLDEVTSPQQARALLVILSTLAANQIPIIISCREADWMGNPQLQSVIRHEVEDQIFRGDTLPDGRPISLLLTEFSEREAREALQAYQVLIQPDLRQLAFLRKPYLVRMFAEWYNLTGQLPNPADKTRFLEVFAGGPGISPEMTILDRLNIRGDTRDLMLDLFEIYLDDRQLRRASLPKRNLEDSIQGKNRNWRILLSAGIFREQPTRTTMHVAVNEEFAPFLLALWQERQDELLGVEPGKEKEREEELGAQLTDQTTGIPEVENLFQLHIQFQHENYPAGVDSLVKGLLLLESKPDIPVESIKMESHLVLILDISGSMNVPDKYPLLRQALELMLKNLEEGMYLIDSCIVFHPSSSFMQCTSGGKSKRESYQPDFRDGFIAHSIPDDQHELWA